MRTSAILLKNFGVEQTEVNQVWSTLVQYTGWFSMTLQAEGFPLPALAAMHEVGSQCLKCLSTLSGPAQGSRQVSVV